MRKIFSFLTAILFAGSMMATDVAVTIYASSGDYYAKTHEWVKGSDGGPVYAQVVLDENITANVIGTGNNGKYYSDWRFYTNGSDAGSFSIDAAEGYELQSVTFTYTVSNSGALYMGETKLASKTAVEVSGQKAVFQCKNTNTSTNGQVRLTAIAVTYQEAVTPTAKYYMKNNWDAAADWTWKEMTQDGSNYKLENVVFGGSGVNYNTAMDDTGATWVPADKIAGDKIAAKDTVNLVLNPTAGTVTATLVGKYVDPEGTKYYMKNCWNAGEWSWKVMTQDGDNWKLENVVYGGTGVNYNTAMDDTGATWVPEASIAGDKIAAKDTVNLVLNPTAGTVTATLVGKYNPDVPPVQTLPVVALAGTMNAWAAANMTAADDSLSASIKVALEAKAYEFKIVSDGKWLSLNGEGESLYAFHRDWTSASHINGIDLRNFELTADVAGEYTFTWTYADSTLTITFPAKPEPVKETLNAFPMGKTDFTTYDWGDDKAKNKVIFDKNNDIMMFSQGNDLKINANYGLQIGNSSKVSAFVFRVGETTDVTVDLARNGSDVTVKLYYMGTTVDTLTSANLTAEGELCATAEISAEAQTAQLVKKDAAAGYYKVVSTLRFCVPAITLGAAPADPTVSAYGTMTNPAWEVEVPFTLAADKKSASFTANIAKGDYNFKLVVNGEWRSNGYTYHRGFPGAAGITGNNDNMIFQADVTGDYTITWTFENDSLGITFPAKPEPVLANGYYLVGIFNHVAAWDPVKEKKLSENELNPGEYYIAATLAAEDSLKVVYVEDDAVKTWYGVDVTETNPNGNYIVDANHAGEKTVWFNPTRQEAWAGHIFVEPNGGTGIDNTTVEGKAVKSLKNGILMIEKNGKVYNVIGMEIR